MGNDIAQAQRLRGVTSSRGRRRPGSGLLTGYHFWTDLRALVVAARDNISSTTGSRNQTGSVGHQLI